MRLSTPLTVFLTLVLFHFSHASNNGPGTLEGHITTSDGKPAASVTITLIGTSKNTVTGEDGTFSINKIPTGNYQVEISLVGYETVVREVSIEQNKTIFIDVRLNVSSTSLQQVIITSGKSKYSHKETDQVARMPLRTLENPQVYQVVGKALMNDQLVTDRADIYQNIAGAVPNFAVGGSQGMNMRGFANTTGLLNGMITSAIVPLNPAILERVDAMKGPSGTLFGSNRNASFGGAFNYITKKPYERFGGSLSYTGGSFELNSFAADVNTPLDNKKDMLLRVNVASQREGSFQDQGFANNYVIAPSFSYQVNDRMKFMLDVNLTRSTFSTNTFSIGSLSNTTVRNFKNLSLPYKRSLTNNSMDVNSGLNNIQARLEYTLSDKWVSQTNYLFSEGYYNHFYWTTSNMLTDSTFSRIVRNQTPETFGNMQLQQNFVGDYNIGTLRNRMVIGLDYNYTYNRLNRVTTTYDTVNIHKPIGDFNAEKLNALSYQKGFSASKTNSSSYGLYVSDVLNITPALMTMLSLRVDRFSTDGTYTVSTGLYTGGYTQTTLSPKFGLVYQPIKNKLSFFANYLNGFVNLGPLLEPDNSVLKLKAQTGDQWEAGVKFDILKNKLNGSISYYNISVGNATRTQLINGQTWVFQDGTQRSKGYELEIIANPVPGLNIIAGYSQNENKYTKASAGLQGKLATAAPKQVGNIWVSYSVPGGKWKGIGWGAGGNYVSDSWFETTNSFVLPAYVLLSASLFYDQARYRVTLKGNNLSDSKYWNSNGTAQKSMNFLASITLKF